MQNRQEPLTLGMIVGNRGFFPDHLARSGREEMLAALARAGASVVAPGLEDTRHGAVETREEARLSADLFRSRRDDIAGIVVTLPNFGEERGIAEAIRMADLDVPVLVQATPDDPARMSVRDRRDSFCGKMSACNNLAQYGIRYSLTTLHTESPGSETFAADLSWFMAVCRVVRGMRGLRVGAIGARPAAFNTVRYSEKILERHRISVDTIDLSEILGRVGQLGDSDPAVQSMLDSIRAYAPVQAVPAASLVKMARLGVVVERWMEEAEADISAVQCWTALEEFFGVVPCTVMSMMSQRLMSSACEVDVCGAVAMHALGLASSTPSALLDWNNNYGDDPDKAVCFHCSNLPKQFLDGARMDYQEIIAGTVGRERTYGTLAGRIRTGPLTFLRLTTDDERGAIAGYVGEGEVTADPLDTFGGAGVVRIPRMQELLRFICSRGFEHHTAASLSHVANVIEEAARYLEWDVYCHETGRRHT